MEAALKAKLVIKSLFCKEGRVALESIAMIASRLGGIRPAERTAMLVAANALLLVCLRALD